jgi:hypothetical protein
MGASTAGLRAVRAFVATRSPGAHHAACKRLTEPQRTSAAQGERPDRLPLAHPVRGRGRAFDTLTINEELLPPAPVGAHWIAARQSAPLLMRFGNEAQRQDSCRARRRQHHSPSA